MDFFALYRWSRPELNRRLVFDGLSESVDSLIFHALKPDGPSLIITPDMMTAERVGSDLSGLGLETIVLQPKELLTHPIYAQSKEALINRSLQLQQMLEPEFSKVVITPVKGVAQRLVSHQAMRRAKIELTIGQLIDFDQLLYRLDQLGYTREVLVENRGEFAQRGDIIDVFTLERDHPVRIEVFGDEIDSIRLFDETTQKSIENLDGFCFGPVVESFTNDDIDRALAEHVPDDIRWSEDFSLERDRYYHLIGQSSTLLDYADFRVIGIIQEDSVYKRLDQMQQDYSLRLVEALERHEALPGEEANLLTVEQLTRSLSEIPQISLNQFHVFDDKVYRLQTRKQPEYKSNLQQLSDHLKTFQQQNYRQVILTTERSDLIRSHLASEGINYRQLREGDDVSPGDIGILSLSLKSGFIDDDARVAVYSQADIFGTSKKKRRRSFGDKSHRIYDYFDLKPGDYVVHLHHGIGRYTGLVKKEIEGIRRDYLELEYAAGDKLFIPTNQVDLIQRYIGGDLASVRPTRLGTNEWKRKTERAKKSIEDLTDELLALYAQREQSKGFAFGPDTPWQREFEADFAYEETPDQLRCVAEIKRDMERSRPMDRLLCGDVGFGKTEVALRAVFKAVMDSKQAAILVPTTILAEQHYNTMLERFGPYPMKVEMLSRLTRPKDRTRIKKGLADGSIDIVVGTHMLLSDTLKFHDLGLLVVDEEQRFGVKHKEKIRRMKANVDTLAMSATPIPRTLNYSLSGIRDMSILQDPPEDRYPIQTYITAFDERLIREAILREVERGGQVYYIYNRIHDMDRMHSKLARLVPEVSIVSAHGQMGERKLEDAMLGFIDKDYDVLLSTTIVETGMDISNVNTIIIEDAQNFGLSQLYQLRGRVGRTNRMAYAYLFYPRKMVLKDLAQDRLNTIKEFTDFGSGFRIAIRDLEIRGSGNLLGASQSGHFEEVGYELYMQMLQEKMDQIRGVVKPDVPEVSVDFAISAYLPDGYIQDSATKMEIYRKIRTIDSDQDRSDVIDELIDRFGIMPGPVEALIDISYLRSLAEKIPFHEINAAGDELTLMIDPSDPPPTQLFQYISQHMKEVQLHLRHKPRLVIELIHKPIDRDKDLARIIRLLERMLQYKDTLTYNGPLEENL